MGSALPRRWTGGWWCVLRLLAVACFAAAAAASLCRGCFFLDGGGVLRSDPGSAAAAAAGVHSGDMAEGYQYNYGGGRRLLGVGLGSHPPRCTSKCGSCSPCYPVHVSVPPGVLVTTEYYPEAWRCKCRDRLFMP